ncbi:flagellar protein FliS [Rubripirellula lacrimiformis]|uniref:Flagellar protein FliS n=1 Tax=Rubripirellula lacrimiformis TaxID=1930273 RepID=A0A517NC07_9BACT|nr:flagellar protein FliS [Rubripirellula lacrimiformis]QDT04548.1 flagellar protein FliS [Rubripirellula lacrimiformis]
MSSSNNPENFRPRTAGGSQQYVDSSIRMASPARLRLMLTERAVEVATTLSRLWRSGEKLGPNEHSLSLLELIGELLNGISGSQDPEEKKLCSQVSDLYVFLSKHLLIAEDTSNADYIDEIQIVLAIEAETWRAVCAQELTSRQSAVSPPHATPSAATSGGLNFSA